MDYLDLECEQMIECKTDFIPDPPPPIPMTIDYKIKKVILVICDYYNIDFSKLGKIKYSRVKERVLCRHMIYYFLAQLRMSTNKIGEVVYCYRRATILHGIKRINKEKELYRWMKDDVETITRRLGTGFFYVNFYSNALS
jgi:chromosomal replication initiation ATPase DnaA